MRALWLNKFDYSGNTEAVIAWAEGVIQTGWQIHLILTEVPTNLLPLYQKYLAQTGLPSSLNINRQQIQNLLFYRNFDLLHAYHPDLFHLAATLGKSFRLPWLAGFLAGEEDPADLTILREANAVTSSNSATLQNLQTLFLSCLKNHQTPVFLIPQGVKTGSAPEPAPVSSSPQPSPSKQCKILYAGPLHDNHLAPFQTLSQVVHNLGTSGFGIFSRRKPPHFNGTFHAWTPAFNALLTDYTFVAGHGYFLLQALAAGKITLLLEEGYAGVFSPFTRRAPVPCWRTKIKITAEKGGKVSSAESTAGLYKLLQQDLQILSTDRAARAKLQEDSQRYTRENHDLRIVSEKIRCLYSLLLQKRI